MNVLVTGDRNWTDRNYIFETLDAVHAATPITLLIEGEASGADLIARAWAEEHGVAVDPHPYIRMLGRAGGPVRNREMLAKLVAVGGGVIIAFHPDLARSRGTFDMVKQGRKAGVPIVIYDGSPPDPEFDRRAYLSLCDELTGVLVTPVVWDEADWDPMFVTAARAFATRNSLPWPPLPDIDEALRLTENAR